jgi:hypothetical protein
MAAPAVSPGLGREWRAMSKQAVIPNLNPHGASSFEHVVATLGLSPEEYVGSAALKEWVRRNKDYKYVPPELLEAWGFIVNVYAA